jgi:transmembrane sensor
MSEPVHMPLAPANDVEARAALWLEERDFGEWNDDAQAALNAWLEESWENRVAFWRLDAAWNRTERLIALRPHCDEAQTEAMRRPMLPMLMGLAAVFAIVAMLGFGAARLLAPPDVKTYATAIGGRETIKFADGTKIELNTNTVIHTRMTTAERTIWLDRGEAYFEVKHDSTHPFRVITGKNIVTDLGTKFSIRRNKDHLVVALLAGRVRFGSSNPAQQSVLLSPGDTITATADSISVTKEAIQALSNALSWREGVLSFDNAALIDVAAEFNRYNREKIVVSDPAVESIRISGTFQTGNADAFIATVQRVFQLRVKRDGETIVISR